MRDVVVFALFVGILPLCFLRPWVGVLTFSWLAYNRTQDLTWGFARTLPIAQFVAIAMIAGWLVWDFRSVIRKDKRIYAILLMLLVMAVSIGLNTVRWAAQGDRFIEVMKFVFVALLSSVMIGDRRRLRQMMLVICLALGFFGVKNGIWFLMGQQTGIGPGGMLKDNNDFALAMVMNLPLLWYMANDVHDIELLHLKIGKFLRKFMRVAFFLTLLTIMATGSRGGFLAMGVTLMAMAWKTKYKLPAAVGAVLVGMAGLALAPQEYIDRLKTITEAADESVMGRLVSWQVAWEMIKDSPVLGIGFKNMVWEYQYYFNQVDTPAGMSMAPSRVAHNSYFQVWAESGSIAFGLFLFMIGSTILFMRKITKVLKKTKDAWLSNYSLSIEITLYGFLVGAMFLNRAHFDLLYQIVAISTAMPAVLAFEQARERNAPKKRRGPSVAGDVWVRHRDPFVKIST